MAEAFLYQQIAENIRQDILNGKLNPGDRLPSMREMTSKWVCTVGTVQRAYQELSRQGLITSRSGQGTRVVDELPPLADTPMRKAALIHRAESFLLEVLTAGYTPPEVEIAVRQALDRWRTLAIEKIPPPAQTVRFAGSHDLVITWIASQFPKIANGFILELKFSGSLGGLIALAEGKCDIAGCHLWDEESDTYNLPFVRRLLPGQKLAVQTLAHRSLGFIIPKGNPKQVNGLEDLIRQDIRFVNRQPGSGSRVWLDTSLRKAGVPTSQITGYKDIKLTHLEVALVVAENQADIGLGLEAAADSYGLDFIPLTLERYDLVIPAMVTETPPIRKFMAWLTEPDAKLAIRKFAGYETGATGNTMWVE